MKQWIENELRHLKLEKLVDRRLRQCVDMLATHGSGADGPGPSVLHLAGGFSLEYSLEQLISGLRFRDPAPGVLDDIETLRDDVSVLRQQRCRHETGAIDQVTERTRALHLLLIDEHPRDAAPVRLFLPLQLRPCEYDVNLLSHYGNTSSSALPYKLSVYLDDHHGPAIRLADIHIANFYEGHGLGSAVLADLCAYADCAQLPIVGELVAGQYGDEAPNVRDERKRRTRNWYERHGFDTTNLRLNRPPQPTPSN